MNIIKESIAKFLKTNVCLLKKKKTFTKEVYYNET